MNWNIKGCSKDCVNCHKEFTNMEAYHCRLSFENEEPVRKDYCEKCWIENREATDDQLFSYWKGTFKALPEPVEEDIIDEPILKHLLKKWLNSNERIHQCFCYILVLMLERSKTFVPKPSIKDETGKERLVYEDKKSGEAYILDNPGLTLKELDDIEKELQDMLKQELQK